MEAARDRAAEPSAPATSLTRARLQGRARWEGAPHRQCHRWSLPAPGAPVFLAAQGAEPSASGSILAGPCRMGPGRTGNTSGRRHRRSQRAIALHPYTRWAPQAPGKSSAVSQAGSYFSLSQSWSMSQLRMGSRLWQLVPGTPACPLSGPKGRPDPAGLQKPVLGATSKEPRGAWDKSIWPRSPQPPSQWGTLKRLPVHSHCSPSQLVLWTPS